ncbi:MAG: hypothetical protein L0Z62_05925 [Gemmataceae bacterium]|nr:hypothetical protein [Gemmataceae bacterium]
MSMSLSLSEAHARSLDDLEVRVFPDYDAGYRAEILTPDGVPASSSLGEVPHTGLLEVAKDVREYGRRLSHWLFQGAVGKQFVRARQRAEGRASARQVWQTSEPAAVTGSGLRFRLWLDPQSPKLHALWWEALTDPERDEPLAVRTAFSRYLRVERSRGGSRARADGPPSGSSPSARWSGHTGPN